MTNPVRRLTHSIHDVVRSQLWPIPTLGVLIAVVLGIVVPHLDAVVDGDLPTWLDNLVFSGDAGAARTVLNAVSSSLITVTSLTFSLTVVTLQLASSQFSPRLLRTFTKDLFVQVTLAVFLATFTFSLTVLRAVRSSEESSAPFVPRMAVTVSFLLAIASVICLVLFLAHLTRQIRVETMLENVDGDARETAESNLDRRGQPRHPVPPPVAVRIRIAAERSGFLLEVDEGQVIRAAKNAEGFISIDRMPGSFIVAGTPVASAWRHDGIPLSEEQTEAVRSAVQGALRVGSERTGAQDVGYGLRQLVDVANKALSPGINDPTTAVHALGHISALLSELTQYQLGPVVRVDGDDSSTARASFARPDFSQHLDIAITQPRHYGSADPLVTVRLLEMLRDLAWTVPVDDLDAVLSQLERLDATRSEQDFDDAEVRGHSEISSRIRTIAAGRR